MDGTPTLSEVPKSNEVSTVAALYDGRSVRDQNRAEDRMNRPHDDLSKLLEEMGGSAEEVAATLRAAGVQGVRNTVRVLNPIVRYVQNMLRRDNLDADVMTWKTFRIHGAGAQEVALPKPVLDFFDAFNRGAYPDLELPVG